MAEQLPQVSKLAGALTEHQRHFESLSSDDRQWVIRNTVDAIGLFVSAVKNRTMQFNPTLRYLYADKVITVEGHKVGVFEICKNADFMTMFGCITANLEGLWMTASEREAFCTEHPDKLSKTGTTFFLHKKDETKPATPDNLEVASLFAFSGGLGVGVNRFEDDCVWDAERQHRLVSPQLGA